MAKKLSKAKRKAAGFFILGQWASMDMTRIMLWSHVSRELGEGLSGEELVFLREKLDRMKKNNEAVRKLGRRLLGHAS